MIKGIDGKTAMVWRLRKWEGGNPDKQVAQCHKLGLTSVSLKIIDGTNTRWEDEGNFPNNQNEDLLPETINALQAEGIHVSAWGWTYGQRFGVPSQSAGRAEAQRTIEVLHKLGITEYWIDAEHQYRRKGMDKVATAYGEELNKNPEITYGLCSYRFPLTHQPNFPVLRFATHVDFWAPQVYFLGDNRVNGGAIQLEQSFRQYKGIRGIPYIPVAPTYDWRGWRASHAQLTASFQKAKDLGCPGVSVWDLPQASEQQLKAIEDFQWGEVAPPPTFEVKLTVPHGVKVTVEHV